MKHFLKGAAVMVVVIIVNMIVHIICNMNDIDLDSTVAGTVSAISALLLYQGLIRIEKNKKQENR